MVEGLVANKNQKLDSEVKRYSSSGGIEWRMNGRLHKTDGPAIIWEDGTKEWYYEGKRHRDNGPAVESTDGSTFWCVDGKLH